MTPRNSVARSRTFTGIAKAMADQWTGNITLDGIKGIKGIKGINQ